MTTYAWPTGRHFVPASHELRVVDNTQRTTESSLSGYVQTTAMPGARWGWGMDFTPHTQAHRAELEAYLLALNGRQHRVQLWDLRNPRPRGNIRLTGVTLGASAAQFATSLTLAGCFGDNALLGGSFETDAGADGIADNWSRYSTGTTGALTASLFATSTEHGAYRQLVSAATLGATTSDRQGIRQSSVSVAHLAGASATLACSVTATAGTGITLFIAWLDAGASVILNSTNNTTATGTNQSLALTMTVPALAVTAVVYIWQHSGSGGAAQMHVDVARLVAGSTSTSYPGPATLLAGDWLGLPNGQLLRVVAEATASELGVMTVDVRHMLRAAVSSGAAITLDKPSALYVRTEAGLALPRMPGNADPGLSVDFIEVFA